MYFYDFNTKVKPQLNPDKYYVYAHCTSKCGTVPTYVGSGTSKRIFDTNRRSKDWTNTFQKEGGFWLYIIYETTSRDEAGYVESKIIADRRPTLNKYHNPDFSFPEEVRELRSKAAKKQWETQTAHPNSIAAAIENLEISREERSLPVIRSDGKEFKSICEAARAVPCSPATIKSRVQSGESWRGFTFKYS